MSDYLVNIWWSLRRSVDGTRDDTGCLSGKPQPRVPGSVKSQSRYLETCSEGHQISRNLASAEDVRSSGFWCFLSAAHCDFKPYMSSTFQHQAKLSSEREY